MSLRGKRTCPICEAKFDPVVEWQICDTPKCANVFRVRRFRARKRCGGDDGGGGSRQPSLFPKPLLAKAKPPKAVPLAEPSLFEPDLHATFGGAFEQHTDGSVSDKNRYYVKSSKRKPPKPAPHLPFPENPTAGGSLEPVAA